MARAFAGVIAGYAIFALSAALLFRLSGRDPHAVPDLRFALLSIAFGIAFAALGGWIAALIGGEKGPAASLTLGAAIAIGAVISLVARPGAGAIWSQLAALFLMAPAAVLAGRMRRRRPRTHL